MELTCLDGYPRGAVMTSVHCGGSPSPPPPPRPPLPPLSSSLCVWLVLNVCVWLVLNVCVYVCVCVCVCVCVGLGDVCVVSMHTEVCCKS
eukprot:COSAG03_NODE_40_length_17307_cov_3.149457_18_plen_90_part_00